MSESTSTGVAVIADVVQSRNLRDRDHGQRLLEDAIGRVNDSVSATQPLSPTVGDECQGMYRTTADAARATLLLRLELGDAVDCRFGLGAGWYRAIASNATGLIQDGSAWWSARSAIEEGKRRETSRTAALRTWYVSDSAPEPFVNAYLLARDQLVGTMDARARRLLLGTIHGVPQNTLAARENISQSAVSHNLRRNGAFAIIEGAALLDQEVTR